MQRTGFEYIRVINNIKKSVNVSLWKKVPEYETKVFQRDTINIFGNPKFTSICLVDKDLIYATTNNEIYQPHLQWDGLGIYAADTKAGTLPSFCYNNTHSDAHVPLPQTINEFNREESMEEEAKHGNGEHAEVEDKLTYSPASRDKDFSSETVSREKFFLIGANTKYGRAIKVNTRYITWKTIFSYIDI